MLRPDFACLRRSGFAQAGASDLKSFFDHFNQIRDHPVIGDRDSQMVCLPYDRSINGADLGSPSVVEILPHGTAVLPGRLNHPPSPDRLD